MRDITIDLLQAISARLASRADCRRIEYWLELNVEDNKLTYQFNPSMIWVYPDMYHRKKSDMIPIVDYILKSKFSDNVNISEDRDITIHDCTLTPGTYHYKLSITKKQRKWFKQL